MRYYPPNRGTRKRSRSHVRSKPTGFILHSGKSEIGKREIVAIATLESANEKTGNMVQVWILPKHTDPLTAIHKRTNGAVCGTCPLEGTWNPETLRMDNRVCYVNLGQAPLGIWHAFKRGMYPRYNHAQHAHLLRGRPIRIGAYGDPAALSTSLVKYLATIGESWTGYSHQLFWIDQRRAKALARYLMVSCHTPAQHAEAKRRGWRSFSTIHPKQSAPAGAVECPHYSHGVTCADCQLCQGTNKQARDVYVIAHSKVGANLPAVQQLQGAQF